MTNENNSIENVENNSSAETCKSKDEQMKSVAGDKKCRCGDSCKREDKGNCVEGNNCERLENCSCKDSRNKCCKCKNCLPIFLSAIACILSITALFKTCNKPCVSVKPTQATTIDDSKIRATVIDVIRNDPQMLIDAMSAGIVKQRSDISKQQALEVNKYKDDLVNTSYTIGNTNAKISVICFFDPLCGGCIEFQKTVIKALQQKKSVCFHLIPVAILGAKSEELVKIYHEIFAKDSHKLTDFVREIIKDPSNVDLALSNISLNASDLINFETVATAKMSSNLYWFEKINASAVPAIFIKSKSGNFAPIEEDELIERLK